MVFQKNTQYALRIFIYLAQNPGAPVSVNQLHKSLGIPYKYLAKLMAKISQSGLLSVTQGKNGGYVLNRNPRSIKLYEIVQINEDLDVLDHCLLGQNAVCRAPGCPMHKLWVQQKKQWKEILYKQTLQMLAHHK